MKTMLAGFLLINMAFGYASDCIVSEVKLNFDDEASKTHALEVIQSKGYVIDETKPTGLHIAVGFKFQEQFQSNHYLLPQAKGFARTYTKLQNVVKDIKNDVSYAVSKKRSEHVFISLTKKSLAEFERSTVFEQNRTRPYSAVLIVYEKKIRRLTSNQSRIDNLLQRVPRCSELNI